MVSFERSLVYGLPHARVTLEIDVVTTTRFVGTAGTPELVVVVAYNGKLQSDATVLFHAWTAKQYVVLGNSKVTVHIVTAPSDDTVVQSPQTRPYPTVSLATTTPVGLLHRSVTAPDDSDVATRSVGLDGTARVVPNTVTEEFEAPEGSIAWTNAQYRLFAERLPSV
jgi:hypothetical protein